MFAMILDQFSSIYLNTMIQVQTFDSMKFSQNTVITLIMHLLTLLKFILLLKDLCWSRVHKLSKPVQDFCSSYHHLHDHQDSAEADNEERRPSPSLGPVPFMSQVVSTLIKKKLTVVELGRSKLQGNINGAEDSAVCAICLACIKGSEEIRELVNCSHVYHRECVDGWIDQGHGTCPLCRRELLPRQAGEEDEDVKAENYDPWRLERMAYLFGEDHFFDNF